MQLWPTRESSHAAIATVLAVIVGGCAGTPSASAATAAASTTVPTASSAPAEVASPSAEGGISGLFDVGGRSLFLECRGTASPTVVFLAGTGVPRTAMRSIEDGILETARACDYDRAGEGRSDVAPSVQTDLDVADDLAALLAAADVPPPYVLVGQSVGGDQAWLYASRHPDGLAGFLIMNAGFFVVDWQELKGVLSDKEIAQERSISDLGLGAEKQAASPPDGVPYVVMMSTSTQCGSPDDVCGRIYPFYEAWAQELAQRTPDGRYVQVDAGHEIYDAQPDFVIDEIRRLLDEVR